MSPKFWTALSPEQSLQPPSPRHILRDPPRSSQSPTPIPLPSTHHTETHPLAQVPVSLGIHLPHMVPIWKEGQGLCLGSPHTFTRQTAT